MSRLSGYLIIDDEGTEEGATIWVPELPGCYVRARTEQQALERLEKTVRDYLNWLGDLAAKILTDPWDGQITIEEVHIGSGHDYYKWDAAECTDKELDNYLKVMARSRRELISLVDKMTVDSADWRPVPYSPRTTKLIPLHIAATEIWYLNQFFENEPVIRAMENETILRETGASELGPRTWYRSAGDWYTEVSLRQFMEVTRRVFEKVVKHASQEERRRVVDSRDHQSNEPWTLRKVLRRAAWHERLHMATFSRFIKQFELEQRAKSVGPTGLLDEAKMADLTSGKSEVIQLTASSIHPDDRPIYSRQFAALLRDVSRLFRVRLSAADSLNFLGDQRIKTLDPDMLYIPEGEFLMGTSIDEIEKINAESQLPRETFLIETQARRINVEKFEIGRYPVTNFEYLQFVRETGKQPPAWWSGTVLGPSFLPWKANHPVWGVSWEDAVAYCEWLSNKTGRKYRLPAEAEWEKAARGTDGRTYPWGNRFEIARCNLRESGLGGSTPVGLFIEGASPFGLVDVAGNVEEWTKDAYKTPAAGHQLGEKVRFIDGSEKYRVTKSGGWLDGWVTVRCASKRIRLRDLDRRAGGRIGFRLVREE